MGDCLYGVATCKDYPIDFSRKGVAYNQVRGVGTYVHHGNSLRNGALLHGVHLNVVDIPFEGYVAHRNTQCDTGIGGCTVKGNGLGAWHHIVAYHIVRCIDAVQGLETGSVVVCLRVAHLQYMVGGIIRITGCAGETHFHIGQIALKVGKHHDIIAAVRTEL